MRNFLKWLATPQEMTFKWIARHTQAPSTSFEPLLNFDRRGISLWGCEPVSPQGRRLQWRRFLLHGLASQPARSIITDCELFKGDAAVLFGAVLWDSTPVRCNAGRQGSLSDSLCGSARQVVSFAAVELLIGVIYSVRVTPHAAHRLSLLGEISGNRPGDNPGAKR